MSNLDLSLYRSIEALADNDIPNPILRIDFFLHAVITGEECNIEPVTKTEEYLYALVTGDESRLGLYGDSISLLEEYLEALRTGDINNLREPRTREEIILYQAITGEDLGVEPVSRIETYLSMLQNAGGLDYILSTSTSASFIPLTNSINGRARVQEMCGDTFVNLVSDINKIDYATVSNNEITYKMNHNAYPACIFNVNGLVNGRTYTCILDVKKNPNFLHMGGTKTGEIRQFATYNTTGRFINKFTIPNDGNSYYLLSMWTQGNNSNNNIVVSYPIILEGDWTNREIPREYFEGMKSCGQDDENGHKIEILSQNKNLLTELQNTNENKLGISSSFNNNILTINGVATGNGDFEYQKLDTEIFLKKNTDYTLKYHVVSGDSTRKVFAYKINKLDGTSEWKTAPNGVTTFNSGLDIYSISRIRFYVNEGEIYNNLQLKVQLEEGNVATEYIQGKLNKKEILLNEPLRGLPNGVRDRIVYLDENTTPIAPEGKGLYLEKNVGERDITNDNWDRSFTGWSNIIFRNKSFELEAVNTRTINVLSNTLPSISIENLCNVLGRTGIASHNFVTKCLHVAISGIDTVDKLVAWFRVNPTIVQYQLQTPTYTKISDVNFECYENATVYVDSGAVAPTKTVIRYPYKQPALFSL